MNILEMAMAAKMGGGGNGGGSGGGSVNSVNGVKPDASGNVNVLAWEEVTEAMTITVPTSYDEQDLVGGLFLKVSDKTPHADAMSIATVTMGEEGTQLGRPIVLDGIEQYTMIFVVSKENATYTEEGMNFVFQETGIYVPAMFGGAVIDIPSVTAIHPIDGKYMPYETAKIIGSFVSARGTLTFTKNDTSGSWVANHTWGDVLAYVENDLYNRKRPCFLCIDGGINDFYIVPIEFFNGSIFAQTPWGNNINGSVDRYDLYISNTWGMISTNNENLMEELSNLDVTFTFYCV